MTSAFMIICDPKNKVYEPYYSDSEFNSKIPKFVK